MASQFINDRWSDLFDELEPRLSKQLGSSQIPWGNFPMWSFCENWWRVFSSQIQKMINRVIYWRDEKIFRNLAKLTKLCIWAMFQFSVEKHSKTFCYLFPKQEIWASFYLAIAAELWDFQRLSQSFWILFLLLSGLVLFVVTKQKKVLKFKGAWLWKKGELFSLKLDI